MSAYCPETMKQVSALQSSFQKVNRILLQSPSERDSRLRWPMDGPKEIVDEMMEALRYTSAVTGLSFVANLPEELQAIYDQPSVQRSL